MNVEVGQIAEGVFASEPGPHPISLLVRDLVPNMGGWGRHGFKGDRVEYRIGAGHVVWGYLDEITSAREPVSSDEASAALVRERVCGDNRRVLEAALYPSAVEVMEQEG